MMQKVIIIGNLGRDPEMRYMPDGTAVTSFSVAASSYRKEGNVTAWFRVSVWGKQAEACNTYLTKGKKVFVEGELSFDQQTGGPQIFQRQDGTTGTSFEVRASLVRFLSGKDEGGEQDDVPAASNSQSTRRVPATDTPDDELF